MSSPYNTGSFAPRVVDEILSGVDLEPELRLKLAASLQRIDDTNAIMFAVNQLADFVGTVAEACPMVPLIYTGVFDVNTDDPVCMAADDWDWDTNPSHILIAGQHAEAGNRPKLAEARLQGMFDEWGIDVKVLSQVNADNTPQQATWVADMVELHSFKAVGIRAHPFHGARAFLTQLATFKKRGLDRKVVLMPWWNCYDPFGQRPLTEPWPTEVWSDVGLISGEAKRIFDYSAKGDVSSYEDLRSYTHWLFNESPVAKALQASIA